MANQGTCFNCKREVDRLYLFNTFCVDCTRMGVFVLGGGGSGGWGLTEVWHHFQEVLGMVR